VFETTASLLDIPDMSSETMSYKLLNSREGEHLSMVKTSGDNQSHRIEEIITRFPGGKAAGA
jgi:hypothetical protein